jgi:hypothetical protein
MSHVVENEAAWSLIEIRDSVWLRHCLFQRRRQTAALDGKPSPGKAFRHTADYLGSTVDWYLDLATSLTQRCSRHNKLYLSITIAWRDRCSGRPDAAGHGQRGKHASHLAAQTPLDEREKT